MSTAGTGPGGYVDGLVREAEAARARLVELLARPVVDLPSSEVSTAMTALHHALRTLRCERARAMVDDDGLSTAEVGRRLHVSRQVCGRLVAEGRQRLLERTAAPSVDAPTPG